VPGPEGQHAQIERGGRITMYGDTVNNKKIIVTGATSGIGRTTAQLLAQAGAEVVAVGRQRDQLELLREESGCMPLALDVTDSAAMQAALAEVHGVDGLVNCSGIALLGASLDLDPA